MFTAHPTVTATASIALWTALHQSEQARAVVRKCEGTSLGGGVGGGGGLTQILRERKRKRKGERKGE